MFIFISKFLYSLGDVFGDRCARNLLIIRQCSLHVHHHGIIYHKFACEYVGCVDGYVYKIGILK